MTTAADVLARPRTYEMVRNLMAGPTVIASDSRSTHEVRWMGRGDKNGEDIQAVPDEILSTVQFRNALRKHILEIVPEDDPAAGVAEELQQTAFEQRMQSSEAAAAAVIDMPLANEMLQFACTAPGAATGSFCGESLMMKASAIEERPALCTRHESLLPQFEKIGDPAVWVFVPQA